MQVSIHHGDVFDVAADCLVCSANVFLTLSGGVGGELLRRYGPATQRPLEDYLHLRGLRYVERGAVIETRPPGVPYRLVLHAVAVDGMYDSTPDVVRQVVRQALTCSAAAGCRAVAMPALATGYGHLDFDAFLSGWLAAVGGDVPGLDVVTLALRDREQAEIATARLEHL